MLDARTKRMVVEALADEYKARAAYRLVLETFGPVRPFVNIVEAEETHAGALEALCRRHGIPLPTPSSRSPVRAPASLLEACEAAAQAERENIAMYDRFLTESEDPEVRQVFKRLQTASRDSHLPAFERCIARGGEPGRGAGGAGSGGPRAGEGRGRRQGWRGP